MKKKRLKKLASGGIYDLDKKRIVANEGGPYSITPANASEMAHKRWQKHREAAATGILKEAMSIDPEIKTVQDAWAWLNARLFSQVADSDKPRAEAVEVLGRNIGAIPRASDMREETAALPKPPTFNAEAVILLAAKLDAELQRRVAARMAEIIEG